MEGKAAGGEKDFSSRLLWQPPAAVYEALEMYNTLYKAHVLKALGRGGCLWMQILLLLHHFICRTPGNWSH